MVLAPVFIAFKLVTWVIHQLNPLYDPIGPLYECKGDGVTLERYAKMAKDLNKPLLFRNSHYWHMCIYPHMLSDSIAMNLYCLGPFTSFGILSIAYSDHHIVFHNGILGTHPAYNNQVTVFFSDEGKAYWHTGIAVLQPFTFFYNLLWEFYAIHMVDIIEESEKRTNNSIPPPEPFTKVWTRMHGSILGEPRQELRKKHGVNMGAWLRA